MTLAAGSKAIEDTDTSLATIISRLARVQQGRERFIEQVALLFTSPNPAFLYIHDPWTPDLTRTLLHSISTDLSRTSLFNLRTQHAFVDCVACFTPKVLYDTVINSLANVMCTWANGCHVWNGGPHGWGDSFDGFLHALRTVHSELVNEDVGSSRPRNGTLEHRRKAIKFVLVFDRAERLRDNLPDLIVPLSRLGELVKALHFFEFAPLIHILFRRKSTSRPCFARVYPGRVYAHLQASWRIHIE